MTKLREAPAPCPIDIDALEAIADWQDDLRARIARRLLVFELTDADTSFDDLTAEVGQFGRVCRALAWRQKAAA